MRAWLLFPLAICTNMSFCSIGAKADTHGKFPGKGSREAYNRSCDPGNKAIEVAEKGDLPAAIKLDREAISIYPLEPCWHHNLGNHLEKTGMLDEARKEHERAVALEPNFLEAWRTLGYEFELQKNYKEAERCYGKAAQIKPNDFEAVGNLGDILRKQSKFTEARQWLLKAKAIPGYSAAEASELQKKLEQCNRKEASD